MGQDHAHFGAAEGRAADFEVAVVVFGGGAQKVVECDLDLIGIDQIADFAGGTVNGRVMQVQAVPEPSTYALLVLAAAALGFHSWRCRRRA